MGSCVGLDLKNGRRATVHVYSEIIPPLRTESYFFSLSIDEIHVEKRVPVEIRGGWNYDTIRRQLERDFLDR